ncbi:MAG: glycosyltransferase family 39 protein, partial [Thermodesulfobacteriota bacterium]
MSASRIARSPLALVLAVVVAVWLEKVIPSGDEFWVYPDTYHYAEMGRQIARGEGFTSLQAYPYLLAWFQAHDVPADPPWPNIARFPFITFVYGVAFRVLGASKHTIDVVGGGFFVATAATMFLLGVRLFGTLPGLLAAFAFATNMSQIAMSRSGLLETGAAFFLVVSMLALVATLEEGARKTGRRAIGPPVLLGLAAGLGVLQRYDLLSFAIAAGLVLLVGRGRVGRRQLLWMLLGFSVPILFWIGRNLVSFGVPIAFLGIDRNLFMKRGLPDPYISTDYSGTWAALQQKSDVILAKLPNFVWPFVRWDQVFGSQTVWLVPAFLAASAYLLYVRHPALRPWAALLLAFLIRTAILTVTHHERRFYLSFAPLLYVFTFGALWTLFASLVRPGRLLRGAVVAATVGLLLLPIRLTLQRFLPGFSGSQADLVASAEPVDVADAADGADAEDGDDPTVGATEPDLESAPDDSPQAVAATTKKAAAPPTILPLRRADALFGLIRERMPATGVIATSWSEEVAWYGERPALNIGPQKLRMAEKLGVRVVGLLYRTKGELYVVNALQRQGLLEEYIPVFRDGFATLWVHRKLVRNWPRTPGEPARQAAAVARDAA